MNPVRALARLWADACLRADNDDKVALLKAAASVNTGLRAANAGLAHDIAFTKAARDTLRRLLEIEKEIAAERYGEITTLRAAADKLGDAPGPHRCRWCESLVDWAHGVDEGALVVDHLDHNRGNNDPSNLVPSCHPCNSVRRPS